MTSGRTNDHEQVYALATRNRMLAVSMFEDLTDAQWATPSLCAGWTVREVCAHLVPPKGGHRLLPLVRDVVRFRGDLERMVDVTTRELARRPTSELVAALRDRAGERLKAPASVPTGRWSTPRSTSGTPPARSVSRPARRRRTGVRCWTSC